MHDSMEFSSESDLEFIERTDGEMGIPVARRKS